MIELPEKDLERRIDAIERRLSFLESQIEVLYQHLGVEEAKDERSGEQD